MMLHVVRHGPLKGDGELLNSNKDGRYITTCDGAVSVSLGIDYVGIFFI